MGSSGGVVDTITDIAVAPFTGIVGKELYDADKKRKKMEKEARDNAARANQAQQNALENQQKQERQDQITAVSQQNARLRRRREATPNRYGTLLTSPLGTPGDSGGGQKTLLGL